MEGLAAKKTDLLIIGCFIGLLLLLYQHSSALALKDLYHMESKLHMLQTETSRIESEMSMLLGGRRNHFDILTERMQARTQIKEDIQHIVSNSDASFLAQDALMQQLESQHEPLETFKRHLSLYQNSLRYLPFLLEQMQEKHPEHHDILHQIYHELLEMTAHLSEFSDKELKQLQQQVQDIDSLKLIAKHLDIMLRNYNDSLVAMQGFMRVDIDTASNHLSEQYQAWFTNQMQEANRYRILLIIFALALLIYIAVTLVRLNRSYKQLKTSNDFLYYLQKAIDDHAVVTMADKVGNIIYANDKFCELNGYTRDEVLGRNHSILKSGEHSPEFFRGLWATISRGKTWHGVLKNKKKDGSFCWMDTSITPLLDEKGEPWQYISVRTDITKQLEAEAQLKESYDRDRTLFELIPYGLGIVQDQVLVYANPVSEKIFHASSVEELLGKPAIRFVHQAYHEQFGQMVAQVLETQQDVSLFDIKLETLDGCTFDAEVQIINIRWQGYPAILLTAQDITARKQEQAERELYRENLEHKQRLESLGVLAGGIAHDFNNILTAIIGNASLAGKKIDAQHEALPYLDKVIKSSDRAADLCQQLLMYSGEDQGTKEAVSLVVLLEDVIDIVTTTMRDQINLTVRVEDNLPFVKGDVRQLQQVVLNLLTNASEAIPEQGSITVELSVRVVASDVAWVNQQSIPTGEYVSLKVVDSGCGMDEATMKKIFEPFFTTKVTGRGLGLSAILGIVHSHGGALALSSKVDQGTTIEVVLPIMQGKVDHDMDQENVCDIQAVVSGTVLVIDDEPSILEVAQDVLKDAGFEVVVAHDGEQGIEKYKAYHGKLSAVVCDMIMPKLGGVEVANYIHEKDPHLPILLSSGYDANMLSNIEHHMIWTMLQKPYVPDELVREVSKAIQNKS